MVFAGLPVTDMYPTYRHEWANIRGVPNGCFRHCRITITYRMDSHGNKVIHVECVSTIHIFEGWHSMVLPPQEPAGLRHRRPNTHDTSGLAVMEERSRLEPQWFSSGHASLR